MDYDRERFIQDYGINPSEFIDVKGLMGDSSDNIPGVSGIGEKRRLRLSRNLKALKICMKIWKVRQLKRRRKKKLSEGKDSAF